METINVEGLPVPVVQALEQMVETLRRQLPIGENDTADQVKQKVKLPAWPGKVIGSLSREDIYEDIG